MPSVKKKSRQEDVDVRITHCNVDLEICMEQQMLVGAVDISLTIQRPGLKYFRFHARQLKVCAVYVEGHKATFDYHNFLDDVMAAAEVPTRQLKAFNIYHKAALEADDMGALVVHFPESFSADHRLHQEVKVRIEYVVDRPRGGVEFASSKRPGVEEDAPGDDLAFPPPPTDMTFQASGPSIDKSVYGTITPRPRSAVHVFALKQALSVRSWLPCINTQSQQCTWSFSYHCPHPNMVVSSGDLVSTSKTFRPKIKVRATGSDIVTAGSTPVTQTPTAPSQQLVADTPAMGGTGVVLANGEMEGTPSSVEGPTPGVAGTAGVGEAMEIDSEDGVPSEQNPSDSVDEPSSEDEVMPTSTRSRSRGGEKKSPVSLSRQFSCLVDDTAIVTRTLRGASVEQERGGSGRRRSPRSRSPKKAMVEEVQATSLPSEDTADERSAVLPSTSGVDDIHQTEDVAMVEAVPTPNATSSEGGATMDGDCDDDDDDEEPTFRQLVTFRFELNVPTAAEDIGFACGPFEVLPDAGVPLVTHFCLPGSMPVLQHTTASYRNVHQFMEDYLGNSLPYDSYKQVFVDGCAREGMAFAGLAIMDSSSMHDSSIIDDAYLTRLLQARLLGEQWFGCFTMPKAWADNWLRYGLSSHLMSIYARQTFGANEARFQNWKLFEDVVNLDIDRPPLYWKGFIHPAQTQELFFLKKAQLVMGMIVDCVGTSDFQKILTNMTTINLENPSKRMWLSTRKFMTTMKKATLGPDVKALERQWVMGRGCPKGFCAFQYNKKRQQTEFVIQQTLPLNERFTGSLCVRINELDGTYDHVVQVDDLMQGFDFECNSRLRKNRKKKYRYVNGDEIIVNLTNRDNPLLWIRVDPQLNWGPALTFKQPMYMWIFQLQMDRDYVAQLLAVNHIADEPTEGGVEGLKNALMDRNTVHFHRTRVAAAMALARVNKAADFSSMELLIGFFKDHFYDNKKTMPLPNDFSNFIMYYLKMGLVTAIGSIRAKDGKTPKEVLEFLLELLRDDDNSLNDYSEYMYIATIIRALGELDIEELIMTSTPRILSELARFLKCDQLLPSFNYEITVSCLKVLCQLQRDGKSARDLDLFFRYSGYGQQMCVRLEAFRALFVLASHDDRVLATVTCLLEDPAEPSYIKSQVVEVLTGLVLDGTIPAAQFQAFLPKNQALCDKLWGLLNSQTTSLDARLRTSLVTLYRCLWGRGTPNCLDVAPGSDDAIAKLLASAAKAKKQKKKRRASEAGLAAESTIRISLKRQRVREDSDDAQTPPSTPLFAKPAKSRIRVRTTTGGGAEEDDEYVPPGGAVRRSTPAVEQLPVLDDTSAPEVLSASSSGTKLKFTIRKSSSSVPAAEEPAEGPSVEAQVAVPVEPLLEAQEVPPVEAQSVPVEAQETAPAANAGSVQVNGAITGPPPPMEELPIPAPEDVREAAVPEPAPSLEEDDAPLPKIRLRLSVSGLEIARSDD